MSTKIERFGIELNSPIDEKKISHRILRYSNYSQCEYFFFENYPKGIEFFFNYDKINTQKIISYYLSNESFGIRSHFFGTPGCQKVLEKIYSENVELINVKKCQIRIITTFTASTNKFIEKCGDCLVTLDEITGFFNSDGYLKNYNESLQGFTYGDFLPTCTYKNQNNYIVTNEKVTLQEFLSFNLYEYCNYYSLLDFEYFNQNIKSANRINGILVNFYQ